MSWTRCIVRFLVIVLLVVNVVAIDSAVASECPADGSRSFALEKAGVRTEYRPMEQAIVRLDETIGRATFTHYLFRGLIEVYREGKKGITLSIPLTDLESVFPLEEGKKHSLKLISMNPKDMKESEQLLELEVTGREEIRLRNCTYAVLAVHHCRENAAGRVLDCWTSLYSPDLRAVLAKRYDEGTVHETTIAYRGIEALPD